MDASRRWGKLDESVPVAGQASQLGGMAQVQPHAEGMARVSGHPFDIGFQLVSGGHP